MDFVLSTQNRNMVRVILGSDNTVEVVSDAELTIDELMYTFDRFQTELENEHIHLLFETAQRGARPAQPPVSGRLARYTRPHHTEDNCPICLERIGDGVTLSVCTHSFHRNCIGTWIQQHSGTCPECRKRVDGVVAGSATETDGGIIDLT